MPTRRGTTLPSGKPTVSTLDRRSEMAAKSTSDDTTPGTKKKKMIIVGALGAVLLLGGGVGGTYMLVKPAEAAATETVKEELVPGDVTALDPVSINLADGHYLKIGLALQGVLVEGGGEGHGSGGPDGSKALDLAIAEFGGLSMADLSNAKQRQHYKDELQEKIITAYKEKDEEGVEHETIMGIYLTEFVMQ
ncbi:flagellar basal body-associated protein FliL (plasmid) [Kineococcus radiotolerans SRS30216 = ATCC BAA-149]|uniref:Flagellar protein FliL n=2 Tax=Kineococcus radiotolerans TaxID=131568 RepID=A6WGR6_KINRD|nr:flagellar basal body-associated protein FliL [Kineococcus radiotolerans SRS30216 = ATCC BAA-149]